MKKILILLSIILLAGCSRNENISMSITKYYGKMDYKEFYGSFRESFLHHVADYDSRLHNGIADLHEGTKKKLKK